MVKQKKKNNHKGNLMYIAEWKKSPVNGYTLCYRYMKGKTSQEGKMRAIRDYWN